MNTKTKFRNKDILRFLTFVLIAMLPACIPQCSRSDDDDGDEDRLAMEQATFAAGLATEVFRMTETQSAELTETVLVLTPSVTATRTPTPTSTATTTLASSPSPSPTSQLMCGTGYYQVGSSVFLLDSELTAMVYFRLISSDTTPEQAYQIAREQLVSGNPNASAGTWSSLSDGEFNAWFPNTSWEKVNGKCLTGDEPSIELRWPDGTINVAQYLGVP
jgi:hypothetical protein